MTFAQAGDSPPPRAKSGEGYVPRHRASSAALFLPIRTPGKFTLDEAGNRPTKHDPSKAWTEQALQAARNFLEGGDEPR
jgi:hypothetical protein